MRQPNGIRRHERVESRRGGFTLVEIIIVAAVVGILAGLAIPNLRTMLYKARAVEMAGEMEVVRHAAQNFQADNLAWPPEAAVGAVPAGLALFLPENYSFVKSGYQLDYENWALPSGLPNDPSATRLIGISVTAEDPTLGNALLELLGTAVVFSAGNTHTIVIEVS
jgi:prepilin-type N-terminal cleavage/methylation domain-containing protein